MDMGEVMTLPPLPRPAILLTVDLPMVSGAKVKKQPFYTEDQMNAHATAAVLAEREACAKIAEDQDPYGDPVQGWFDIISAKIRARSAV